MKKKNHFLTIDLTPSQSNALKNLEIIPAKRFFDSKQSGDEIKDEVIISPNGIPTLEIEVIDFDVVWNQCEDKEATYFQESEFSVSNWVDIQINRIEEDKVFVDLLIDIPEHVEDGTYWFALSFKAPQKGEYMAHKSNIELNPLSLYFVTVGPNRHKCLVGQS